MSVAQILSLSLSALLIGWLVPRQWRIWFMLVASLLAVYWLQPSTPIRNLDFWLPTLSIALTVLVWTSTRPVEGQNRLPLAGALFILIPILLIGLTRYIDPICCITPSLPPDLPRIGLGMAIAAGIIVIPYLFPSKRRLFSWLSLLLLLTIFVVLKTPALALRLSAALRAWTGQPIDLANPSDVVWLGFSFLAFRLIHMLRDYQTGRLPGYSMEKLVTYAIFFPSYISGPIDRSQRWIGELEQINSRPATDNPDRTLKARNTVAGLQRILIGMFKKFVLADSLALFALSPQNAGQTTSALWMWILLFSYTLRIYFDFSGYTDIAIGLGRLMGFHLPENFDRPYLKQNLTAFWNSWHITLAQWFRTYFFNPLTRSLRMQPRKLPTWMIIFLGQVSTMALIGLWHGITWNFLIWGVWHGLGLFIHNRWSEWARLRIAPQVEQSFTRAALSLGSWLMTFLFVALGWVWFALPDPANAVWVFRRLFGL
jgi:alginate O-acetyltransferase complex protein AlgI